MTLIQNWKSAWKFSSVQTALILAAANGLFAVIPLLSELVSVSVYALISLFGNVAIVALRLVAQPSIEEV